jgi:hypothetical protein
MIKIIKKILGIINSIVLCFRFPFLYPRNRFSGKHEVYIPWIMKLHNRLHKKSIDRFILSYKFYKDPEEFKNGSFSYKEGNYTISLTNDGIIRILGPKESSEYNLQQHVGKDFRLLGIEPGKNFMGDSIICYHISKNEVSIYNYGFAFKTLEIVKNKFYHRLSNILDWIYENIIQPVCFIPTYTELDAMPKGWRKCFGISMCKEIKASLKRHNYLKEYRITQIKEKWGGLRWYDAGAPEEVYKIIQKYEYISARTCIMCGKPATKISIGYISPYCDDCYKSSLKDHTYSVIKDWYGWVSSKSEDEQVES